MNPFSLQDRRIVVTGGSSGIGLACAQEVARSGGRVVLIARNPERLDRAVASLAGAGHAGLSLDVTDSAALQAALEGQAAHGRIDGLVCCAGVKMTLPLRAMTADKYQEVFKTNVVAALETARIVVGRTVVGEHGASLVFLSSIAGLCGQGGLTAYAAAKGALIAAAKTLAVELAGKNVRVNCVSPGHVLDTGMSDEIFSVLSPDRQADVARPYPLGLGRPDDVAWAVAFLLSGASRWMTGANLVLDGGYSAQ
jgi:NAD(P)-dependent dehydrogenase (short-subunit alcohol dehydrogenase family)